MILNHRPKVDTFIIHYSFFFILYSFSRGGHRHGAWAYLIVTFLVFEYPL